MNSTWPTLPFGSAVQALFHWFKSLAAQVGRLLGNRTKTLARQSKCVIAPFGAASSFDVDEQSRDWKNLRRNAAQRRFSLLAGAETNKFSPAGRRRTTESLEAAFVL